MPKTGKQQRVVLLAGPHKTASSSIQFNMFHWLKNESHASGLTKNWAWPSPLKKFQEDGCKMNWSSGFQIFYWWIQALMKRDTTTGIHCISDQGIYSRQEMIDHYKREFYNQWMEGRSLVIASEAMDFVGSEQLYKYPDELREKIILQLPWHVGTDAHYPIKASGSDDNITVVIMYRSPRSGHLTSLWHQCCMEDLSFHDFLISKQGGKYSDYLMKSLDSLKLAKKFLDRGLEVVVVDMAGVQANGYDISNVIACDILGAECTNDKRFHGSEHQEKVGIINVKTHSDSKLNVTLNQLDQMNAVIQKYDCNFVALMGNAKLKILYSYALQELFDKCQQQYGGFGDHPGNRKQLMTKIVAIASQ